MSHLLQWLLVGPLVVGAAVFAGWRLLAAQLRLRVMSALLRWLPASTGGLCAICREKLARRIAAAASGGGCAACSKH